MAQSLRTGLPIYRTSFTGLRTGLLNSDSGLRVPTPYIKDSQDKEKDSDYTESCYYRE